MVTEAPPPYRLILAQAIPRTNRLEFILEKGTELGMTEIWLFASARSERRNFSEHQEARLKNITIAALKQCGRLFLPTIVMLPQIKDWPKLPYPAFFGDTQPSAPILASAFQKHDGCQEVLFCIGPESGFTPEETTLLQTHGANGVKLHPNILRTDTAALAALSLLSHWMLTR